MKTEKVTQLVLKLIKLTRYNEIKWDANSVYSPELPNGEFILDKIYKTTFSSGKFQMYRYKFKAWMDEDRFEWSQRIRLELVDGQGHTDYEFEYENSMNDLYEIVREQTSNVEGLVDNILGLNLEIVEATYYTQTKSLDLTDILKEKIQNNKLVVFASNDLAGDPQHGAVKKLKVSFTYAGETLEKEVSEGQTLRIP